ncbi:MAG: crossover junction endodeoxyribonuclease RuvC [Spirochaetia bacterium]
MIRVLGIDPGLASMGWGVVEIDGTRYRHIAHGVIKTSPRASPGERLMKLHHEIKSIISTYGPEQSGVEDLYFAKNATSAIPVAQARGVVLLALTELGVNIGEYSPQAIKQAIVGQGRAEKHQVQELVRMLLGLESIPKPDHASDALAAAICHITHTVGESYVSQH